jgi:DNA-binding XRE family transcriptional regulator
MKIRASSKLRFYRKKHGLKQRELAELWEVSIAMISVMETGRKKINELWARRFGEYFGIPWKKFMHKENK